MKAALFAVLIFATVHAADAGERFLLGPPGDGDPVCSILVPTGWFPEAISNSTAEKYRFIFKPVKGTSPTIILDVDDDVDARLLLETWRQQQPSLPLLDGGKSSGQEFYDVDRRASWNMVSNDYATSVTVQVARDRLYRLCFVDNSKASRAFLNTVRGVIDSCDFKGKLVPPRRLPREALVERFKDIDTIPFELSYHDLIGIPGLQWKLGIAVCVCIFSLAGLERFLRAKKDAQRVADAEAAIAARQEAELSPGGFRRSLLDPEEPQRGPVKRHRRLKKVSG